MMTGLFCRACRGPDRTPVLAGRPGWDEPVSTQLYRPNGIGLPGGVVPACPVMYWPDMLGLPGGDVPACPVMCWPDGLGLPGGDVPASPVMYWSDLPGGNVQAWHKGLGTPGCDGPTDNWPGPSLFLGAGPIWSWCCFWCTRSSLKVAYVSTVPGRSSMKNTYYTEELIHLLGLKILHSCQELPSK